MEKFKINARYNVVWLLSWCRKGLFFLLLGFGGIVSMPGHGEENRFKKLESEDFKVVLVDSKTNFSAYKKVHFFPLSVEKMTLSSAAEKSLRRNWRHFSEREAPGIIELCSEVSEAVFSKSEAITLTAEQDRETLVMQVQVLELLPVAYLDTGLDTVGSEYVRQFAAAQYRIVAMDPATKKMVLLIEDILQVRRYNSVLNNRAMHRSAWKVSYEALMEDLEKQLTGIVGS